MGSTCNTETEQLEEAEIDRLRNEILGEGDDE